MSDVADRPTELVAGNGARGLTREVDGARTRLDQTIQHLQRRRLARARSAHQHKKFAAGNREGQLLDDGLVRQSLAETRNPQSRDAASKTTSGGASDAKHRDQTVPGAPTVLQIMLHAAKYVRKLRLDDVCSYIAHVDPSDTIDDAIEHHQAHLERRREVAPTGHLDQFHA